MRFCLPIVMLTVLIGVSGPPAGAQEYPVRPIRLIVPFGAGTSTDITSRIIGQGLSQQLKQPVVIENKPGAGGNIGTEAVAKAKPDGYTLTMGTVGTLSINTSLYRKISFDPLRDFVPLSFMGFTPTLLVAKPDTPFANVADLIAYAKKNPNKLTFSSAGNGTTGHLAGELLKTLSGTSIVHVPFKEGSQALTAVISGEVDFMFYHPAAVMSYVTSGRLKALAASGERRAAAAPNVPTVAESGFPGFNLIAWYMLAAPAAIPPTVVGKLVEASERTLKNPDILQKLDALGVEQSAIPAADLRVFLTKEITKWAKVIQASGAHID
jgi:tripartite-type tricarboxylate transporter receptor subunit TctC